MNRPLYSPAALVAFATTCIRLSSPAALGQVIHTSADAANPFIQEMVDAVSRDSLSSYIGTLQAFGNRYESNWQRDSAATYILNTFKSFGITAESDSYAWGTEIIRDLEIVSHDSIWAVGDHLMIVASTDAGLTWKTQTTPTPANYFGVDFADRFTGWAVGGGRFNHPYDRRRRSLAPTALRGHCIT